MKSLVTKYLRKSEKYTKIDMVYLFSGNFWLILGRVMGVGGGFILTIAFGNLLSPTEFGTYKYILSIIGLVGAISLTGLTTAGLKEVSQGNKNIIPQLFKVGIWWSIPGSLITLLIAGYYLLQTNYTIGISLLLVSLVNPILNNLGLSKSLLIGLKDFKTITIFNIYKTLLTITPLLISLYLTSNVLIIISVYLLSNLFSGYLIYRLANKKHKVINENKDIKEAVSYSKHMTIINSVQTAVSQLDQLILWHFTGPVQLATYTFALAPVRELKNFSENFFPLIFPKFAIKTIEELKRIMPTRMIQMFGISGILTIIYIILAPFFFSIFFPQYTDSVLPSQLIALTLLLQSKGLIDIAIVAHAKTKLRYLTIVSSQLIKLLLLITLIPLYGLMGAIIAILISEIVNLLIFLIGFRVLTKNERNI